MVVLDGDDADGRFAVTQLLARGVGGRPYVISAAALPPPGPELALTARLIDRELALGGGVAIIEPVPRLGTRRRRARHVARRSRPGAPRRHADPADGVA